MVYIMAVWALSALISIPPLLRWKKDPDRSWFYQIKNNQSTNMSDFEYMDLIYKEHGEEQFKNFTQTLEDTVFPKCQVKENQLLKESLVQLIYDSFLQIGADNLHNVSGDLLHLNTKNKQYMKRIM